MRNKIMNVFLAIGIVAIVIMLLTFDVSYDEIWNNLSRAGWWFIAVVLIWLPIYLLNACSWNVIINNGSKHKAISFVKVLKYTISGYALNYVTPVGVLGGEPYRIMEIKPYLGTAKATSSVILYAMMHIFSHFCFWLSSVLIYVFFYPVGWGMGIVLGLITLFCLLFVTLFIKGYRNGMAVACIRLGSHIPFLKKRAVRFAELHKEKLETIDSQIALLHQQRKSTFYSALGLEYTARIVGCLEVWLILNVLTTDVSFVGCILIVAFSSLLANLLFFLPMQLGGREGGFALAVAGLSLSGAYGVFAALITRVREMVWIVIGLVLMKIGNRR